MIHKTLFASAAIAGAIAMAVPAFAKDPMVGGAAMYASKNIVENAVHSKDHTTLVAAVKAAGLGRHARRRRPVHRLRADQRGVQAKLPAGTVDNLLKPENKSQLARRS